MASELERAEKFLANPPTGGGMSCGEPMWVLETPDVRALQTELARLRRIEAAAREALDKIVWASGCPGNCDASGTSDVGKEMGAVANKIREALDV